MADIQSTHQCPLIGCERPTRGRYCSAHQQRVRKYGHPMADVPIQERASRAGKDCRLEECSRPVKNGLTGLCDPHYKRRWRDAEADLTTPVAPRRSEPIPVVDLPGGLRVCQGCDEAQPLVAFHRDSKAPLGRRKTCKSCRVAAEMERYWQDPALARTRMQSHRALNVDHVRKRDSARYEAHRLERIERSVEQAHRRRAAIYAGPRDRGISRLALRGMDGDSCCYCSVKMVFASFPRGKRPDNQATIEHVTPISRGGFHVWENCTLACWRCNISKGARDAGWRIRGGHRLASNEVAVGA